MISCHCIFTLSHGDFVCLHIQARLYREKNGMICKCHCVYTQYKLKRHYNETSQLCLNFALK